MDEPSRNQETIPDTAFDIDAVSRITGMSSSHLVRWDRNGFFSPSLADPNRRRPASRIYSRNDIVALRIITLLRAAGVPQARLRAARQVLMPDETGGYPPSYLYVADRRVYRSREEAITAQQQNGTPGEPTTIDVKAVSSEVDEAIARLTERRPEEIGQVTRRRGTLRGEPVVAGTRIPTGIIAWFDRHGYSRSWILANFPRLTAADVQAAIEFENLLQSQTPASTVASH